MVRFYYKCPIEAAYMAKNFGVEYTVGNNTKLKWHEFSSGNWRKETSTSPGEYYYVNLHSSLIFMPKKDDAIIDCIGCLLNYRERAGIEVNKILLRNGKTFIMPEIENG